MGVIQITRRCQRCAGTGLVSDQTGGNPDGSCDRCGGSGETTFDSLDLSDIEDKLDDILDKCNDIFEKVSE